MSRVVLDAVGGDHGTKATIEGARIALDRGFVAPGELVLAGPTDEVRDGLAAAGIDDGVFEVLDAADRLDGTETPVEAMRRKPRNAVAVGIRQLKEGHADGFVSAGSTGLVVAAATFGLRCLEGVRRPGIAATMPGRGGPFVVIDVGANPQPKPRQLLVYALMGSAYYHDLFGKERPRVGLLNIGSEEQKGHALAREARALLSTADADFEFVGNVEGPEIYDGRCDVVVTDGFTGNVFLKVSEGVAEFITRSFTGLLDEEQVVEERKQRILGKIMKRVDYSEYGGALLLGVEGIVTICHGRSTGSAIANAIRVARRAVGARVNAHIVQAVERVSAAPESTESA